ncbi:MAG: damage-control phosphatase ARMT1 family protein [Spirochaetaceae bacterium]|nr:damage-control phosphatase ARMT1 family protein [Spirochaetaceae bacterium]
MKPDPGTREDLPPPLHTGTPGSFARRTIEQRKHSIIADLLATGRDGGLASAAVAGLRTLDREIGGGRFGDPFAAGGGPPLLPAERYAWQQALRPLIGRPWLDLPWYEAEASFYLRVLTATGYYERAAPGYGRDPFAHLKQAELQRNAPRLAAELADAELPVLLRSSLWGNRVDLSNYEIDRGHAGVVIAAAGAHAAGAAHSAADELVIDHASGALRSLARARRVDIVTDNAGAELTCDLALVAHLLASGVRQVRLHVKDAPFFVSDATAADLHATLAALHALPPPAQAIARRLTSALADGSLRVQAHWFWNGPRHYPDLPKELAGALAQANLVIFKGDVNYRRLLSDRQWPPDADVGAIVRYLPAPALILRTLKSEIVAGLAPGQAAQLAGRDREWLINGRRGIIQLVGAAPE